MLSGLAFDWLLVAGVACGGGDGGSTPTAATPIPATPAPATPPTKGGAGSSALADNSPRSKAGYDNLGTSLVTVPVEQHAFDGRHVFVKLSREDGQVRFLGEVAPALPFSVSIQMPVGAPRVDDQVLSKSGAEQIVFGAVSP